MNLRFLLPALILICFSPTLWAQTGGATAQSSLLPEIDPQDIEIRSEFRARFPGIRRQPILGFNPKPRIFRIDPNRIPFMENIEDAVASLDNVKVDRPDAPRRSILPIPDRTNVYVRTALGNFLSSELDAYVFQSLGESEIVSADLNFSASDGHLDSQQSSFRFMNLNGYYGNTLKSGIKFSANAGLNSDFNHLYNLDPSIPVTSNRTPKKEYLGIHGAAVLESNKNTLEGWKASLNARSTGIDLSAFNTALVGNVDEQVAELSFINKWAGNQIYEIIEVGFDANVGTYSSSTFGSLNWYDIRSSVNYSRLFNYSTKVAAKGGLAYINDGVQTKFSINPELSVVHTLRPSLSFSGSIYGKPELATIWDHHQKNRFLNENTNLRQSYTYGANAGVEFSPLKLTKVFAKISYDIVDNYAFYAQEEDDFGGNIAQTFYSTSYDDAKIFELSTGINQQLINNRFWFDAELTARSPKLDSGTEIPFEERLSFIGTFTAKPMSKLQVSAWAEFIGERNTANPANTLNPFTIISGSAELEISEKIGVYLKALNILSQNYEIWEGYQERPFQVFGGVTVKL